MNAMATIESIVSGYVISEKGTEKGYKNSIITHKTVLRMNTVFPTTVYTPPHPVL